MGIVWSNPWITLHFVSLYCWEGIEKEKVKVLILRRELITILQLTIWDWRCTHLIPSPLFPVFPCPPHPLFSPSPISPSPSLSPLTPSPPSAPLPTLPPQPLSLLSPSPRLPLSISALFYGYLKLLKAKRKGKKSKQGLDVGPKNGTPKLLHRGPYTSRLS